MDDRTAGEIRALLAEERTLALGVLVDGLPWVGLLPYAPGPRFDAVWVHASRLARHTKGLGPGAPFSALFHRGTGATADPLQIPRLTAQGTVEALARDGDEWQEAQGRYLSRFPASETTFALGDFGLYRLQFERARWVGGFARAVALGPRELRRLGEG